MSCNDTHLEAALLFGAHPTVPLASLCCKMNRFFAAHQISLQDCSPAGDMFAILSSSSFHIIISQNATPVAAASLTDNNRNLNAMPAHRKHIMVSVGFGPYQAKGKRRPKPGNSTTQVLGIKALHRSVLALIELCQPIAIYWAPTARLLPPDELSNSAKDDFPAALAISARQIAAPSDDGGPTLTGYEITQSVWFFGKPLMLAAPELCCEEANALAVALLQGYLDAVLDMTDGSVVTFCDEDQLYFSHQAGDLNNPNGFIQASFSPPAPAEVTGFTTVKTTTSKARHRVLAKITARFPAAPLRRATARLPTPRLLQQPRINQLRARLRRRLSGLANLRHLRHYKDVRHLRNLRHLRAKFRLRLRKALADLQMPAALKALRDRLATRRFGKLSQRFAAMRTRQKSDHSASLIRVGLPILTGVSLILISFALVQSFAGDSFQIANHPAKDQSRKLTN